MGKDFKQQISLSVLNINVASFHEFILFKAFFQQENSLLK